MSVMDKKICRDGHCDFERSEIVSSDIEAGNNVIMAAFFIVAVVLVAVVYNLSL